MDTNVRTPKQEPLTVSFFCQCNPNVMYNQYTRTLPTELWNTAVAHLDDTSLNPTQTCYVNRKIEE